MGSSQSSSSDTTCVYYISGIRVPSNINQRDTSSSSSSTNQTTFLWSRPFESKKDKHMWIRPFNEGMTEGLQLYMEESPKDIQSYVVEEHIKPFLSEATHTLSLGEIIYAGSSWFKVTGVSRHTPTPPTVVHCETTPLYKSDLSRVIILPVDINPDPTSIPENGEDAYKNRLKEHLRGFINDNNNRLHLHEGCLLPVGSTYFVVIRAEPSSGFLTSRTEIENNGMAVPLVKKVKAYYVQQSVPESFQKKIANVSQLSQWNKVYTTFLQPWFQGATRLCKFGHKFSIDGVDFVIEPSDTHTHTHAHTHTHTHPHTHTQNTERPEDPKRDE
eukprot:GHVR01086504.1.p1 GENE.GHVR01086504.1~~GHVR01086504.1.p1  ORF type:complete len:329 (-),score=105.70 GHVR01086504.1:22-1008(-)